MNHNKNPAAVSPAGGAGKALTDRSDPISKLPTRVKNYWVEGRTEFWRIPNFSGRDERGDIIEHTPPGKGWWARIADRHDGHTLWQRKVRR
jgi:hypothetical protein